ncbi:MAG: hypothetical protein ABIW31_01730, partial [Novosphingobium sp.]
MIHPALTELLTYTQEHAGPAASRLADFVLAYFENADPDEIQTRGPATLFAIASAHWRLADAPCAPQSARVRVFNPTLAEDGYVSEHTAIQIVNDDMPFLVDSVTMAVNRSGRTAHWIVHPLLSVQRDEQGHLVKASSASHSGEQARAMASFILVECDRVVSEADRAALASELARILGDVRAVVQDWRPMLSRLDAVADASAQSRLTSENQQEGVEFLHWLEAKHFTFLGARDYNLVRDGDAVSLVAIPESGLGVLRGAVHTPVTQLPADAVAFLDSDQLVLITKAMTRATVHRPAWLDYIGVKRFDAAGQVVGEARFL